MSRQKSLKELFSSDQPVQNDDNLDAEEEFDDDDSLSVDSSAVTDAQTGEEISPPDSEADDNATLTEIESGIINKPNQP